MSSIDPPKASLQPVEKPPLPYDDRKTSEKGDLNQVPTQPVVMATIQNDDERMLARIGYKQVRCCHYTHMIGPANSSCGGTPFLMDS